ncbi:hypothetical protein THAOC_26425, partial [Thalassiosira oceanica]
MGRRRLGETQTATTLGSAEGPVAALDEELTTRKLNTSPLPLYASKVRIQHNGEGEINIMEVEVYSGGNNVALQSNGGTAELSSTHSSSNSNYHLAASTAIDGDTSNGYKFAHSDDEYGAYLEIDLGQVYNIESVKVFNRPSFEDRLSDSTVTLRSPSDEVLHTYEIGDASSLSTVNISASDFDPFNRCGEIDICINRCLNVYNRGLEIVDPNDIPALKQFRFPGHWNTNEARGGYCSLACIGGIAHDAETGADGRITSYNNGFCAAPDAFSSCIDNCNCCTSKQAICRSGCEFWRRTEFDPFSPFNLPTPEGDDTSFDVKGSNFGTSDFRIEMDLTGMGR